MKPNSSPLSKLRLAVPGLTQKRAAKKLKIGAMYLCRIERGHVPISAPLLPKMAKLYQVEEISLLKASRQAQTGQYQYKK